MKNTWQTRLLHTFSSMCSAFFILVLALCVFLGYRYRSEQLTFLFDHTSIRLVTGSMEPVYQEHDYLLIKRVKPETLSVGDVITFYSTDAAIAGQLNTHRIMECVQGPDGLTFITKGDANQFADSAPVHTDAIVGKVTKKLVILTWLGRCMQNSVFVFVLLMIPFLSMLATLYVSIRSRIKRAHGSQETSEAPRTATSQEAAGAYGIASSQDAAGATAANSHEAAGAAANSPEAAATLSEEEMQARVADLVAQLKADPELAASLTGQDNIPPSL